MWNKDQILSNNLGTKHNKVKLVCRVGLSSKYFSLKAICISRLNTTLHFFLLKLHFSYFTLTKLGEIMMEIKMFPVKTDLHT